MGPCLLYNLGIGKDFRRAIHTGGQGFDFELRGCTSFLRLHVCVSIHIYIYIIIGIDAYLIHKYIHTSIHICKTR